MGIQNLTAQRLLMTSNKANGFNMMPLNKFSLVQTRFAGFTKKTNEDGEKASDQQKAKEDAREQAKKASGGSSMIPIIAGLLLLGGGTVSITS
jgi:hypothetical protein